MRINERLMVRGARCALVPYCAAHVPRYHDWMASDEMRTLTASEPLSIEEEFAMQRKWREDDDSELANRAVVG